MELSVLQLFVDVMRHGSFAAAAREHDIDPSSVSRAISGLEDELGLRLFQRTTRKLSPTESGVLYCQRIEPLVREMQEATEFTADQTGTAQGTLRVSTTVSFGSTWIAPQLDKLQSQYPKLTVELLMNDAVVDLVTDRIDLAIRLARPTDSTLIAQRLMKTSYRVCASPHYLKGAPALCHPEQLSAHPCLLFPLSGYRNRWRFQREGEALREIPISGKTLISSATALRDCAIKGMGVSLLPGWLIDTEIEKGSLIDLFPDYQVTATDFETSVWLVYPSRHYVPLKLRVFIEFLREHCRPSVH